jgi:phytoene/squalene synthetase
LRDLKDDMDLLNRSYFPNLTGNQLDALTKQEIIADIENDFEQAYIGIKLLPNEAKFGVYTAYLYYKQLLLKLKKTEAIQIKETRIRVSNSLKLGLLVKSFVNYKLNLL